MEKFSIDKIVQLPQETDINKILNINVGILGHIDSGKTSLCKKLSSVASTAAFDKNPQSQERGITLDLGFSAFYIKTPNYLKLKYPENERLVNSEYLQLTLVDCPGHASLIKTVIAGANIIDTIVLVIDIIKGIQPQTTECLILGEILVDKIVVALNKIDQMNQETMEKDIENKITKLKNAFSLTKFGKDVSINPVSAKLKDKIINQEENENYIKINIDNSENTKDSQLFKNEELINNLIANIIDSVDFNKKSNSSHSNKKEFLFTIDHCFNIKNKGTIVTGTVLKGKISSGDDIFFPEICQKKTIKEMQMFKKTISRVYAGDRVGMLIKNLDHTQIERSIACNEGFVQSYEGGIFILKKVKYYKSEISSNSKFYVIVGNQGTMAKCVFFNKKSTSNKDLLNENISNSILNSSVNLKQFYISEFDFQDKLVSSEDYTFAYLKFDHKMMIPPDMIALGSKIDLDVSHKSNRLAFYGKIIDNISSNILPNLKIFKMKNKIGTILRIVDDKTAIVKGLFKKESNVDDYMGKKVLIVESQGKLEGRILSTFGQTGKVKVEFSCDIKNLKLYSIDGKEIDYNSFSIVLEYKKYIKLC